MNVRAGGHSRNGTAKRQKRNFLAAQEFDEYNSLHTIRVKSDIETLPVVQSPAIVQI